MYYGRELIERIRQQDMLRCFPDAEKKGREYRCDCPNCGHPNGLHIYYCRSYRTHAAKCFHCGIFIGNPIDAVKIINHWHSDACFPQVVREAARVCDIYIDE